MKMFSTFRLLFPQTLLLHSLPPTRQSRLRQRGFTLLEIMLVVIIIALLLGAAVKFMGGNVDVARQVVVQSDLQNIGSQLRLYEALTGSMPTTEQGLQALVTQPQSEPKPARWQRLLDQVPKDPWQQEYIYVYPGKHNPQGYDLYSKGSDHIADTADDLGNWK